VPYPLHGYTSSSIGDSSGGDSMVKSQQAQRPLNKRLQTLLCDKPPLIASNSCICAITFIQDLQDRFSGKILSVAVKG